MTTPEPDLERALRRRAAGVDGAPLSLESVQRRARGIRRRRTALTVVAAAAAVAVVVPVGLSLGGGSSSPSPASGRSSAPSALETGVPSYTVLGDPPADQTTSAALPIPYWYDGQVVAPDGSTVRVDAKSGEPIDELVREAGGGWKGVQVSDAGTLLRLHFDDTGSILAADGTQTRTIGVTPDGRQFAYLVNAADGSSGLDGKLTRGGIDPMQWTVPAVSGDSGVAGLLSDGTVVVTASAGEVQLARSSGSLDDLPGGYVKATSVATATDRIAVQISYRDDGTSCWAVVRSTGARTARTCRWQLLEFSPDGRYLLAADSSSDGMGPRELVMLSATTLRPVARFTADADGFFGPAVWAGDAVLASVWIDGTWHVEQLTRDGVRQVRGFAVPDPEGLTNPIHFAAGPLAE